MGESETGEAETGDVNESAVDQPSQESRNTEDAPPVSKEPDKIKPSALASFHRQQKEFQARVQAFNAEKAEMDKFKSALENAKEDRLAALELMGYTDIKDFLTSIAEDGGRMTPERRELNQLKKWREEQETQAKKQQEQYQAQQQNQALQGKLDALRGQVQNTIKSEAYTGRLINLSGSDEQVMLEMDKMALETGEMPQIEDAIERVENKFQQFLEQMSENPKIRSFFQEKLRSSKLGNTAPSQSKSRGNSKTIGSEVRSPGLRSGANLGPSDDGEREMQEALAFLKNAAL